MYTMMSDWNWRVLFHAHMALDNDWAAVKDYSDAVKGGIVWC